MIMYMYVKDQSLYPPSLSFLTALNTIYICLLFSTSFLPKFEKDSTDKNNKKHLLSNLIQNT